MSALRKVSGQNVFDQPMVAAYRLNRVLVADTAATFTMPATVTVDGVAKAPTHVLIIPTVDIYMRDPNGVTATVPGAVIDGTACALVRAGDSVLVGVGAGDTISVISSSAGPVQAWVYGM